jgi:hypothetical protein
MLKTSLKYIGLSCVIWVIGGLFLLNYQIISDDTYESLSKVAVFIAGFIYSIARLFPKWLGDWDE